MKNLIRPAAAIALAGLLSACATTEEGASKMVALNDGPDPEAVRCKTVVKTGTRMGTKVCKTNREWEQARIDAREATELIQRGSLQGPGPDGG